MALTLDGTPAFTNGGAVSSYTVGPLTSTFANGKVVVGVYTNTFNGDVTSVTGGSLSFTNRAAINQNGSGVAFTDIWTAPVGGSALSAVTFTVNFGGGAQNSGWAAAWVVSAAGDTTAFDAGGPVTSNTTPTAITTSETAFVYVFARFGTSGAPTATSPWNAIVAGQASSFFASEYQVVAAGTYTGVFSGTDEAGVITDAIYDSGGGFTAKFRKTLSQLGGRVGSRQAINFGNPDAQPRPTIYDPAGVEILLDQFERPHHWFDRRDGDRDDPEGGWKLCGSIWLRDRDRQWLVSSRRECHRY